MTRPTRRHGRAGGSLLAISIIAGTVAGTIARQPSIGFLAGLGIGIMLLILVWASDRRSPKRSADAPARPDDAAHHRDL